MNRLIFSLFLFLALPVAASCDGAPSDAVLVVPSELSRWLKIDCTARGHVLSASAGYKLIATSNARALNFPALGLGGIPANSADGVALVIGRSGAYAPLLGGNLMSPHDAYFSKARTNKIEGEFLAVANQTVSREKSFDGPYPGGYLLDLLSNQTFQYRLYVLFRGETPHLIHAVFQAPRQQTRQVTLMFTPD